MKQRDITILEFPTNLGLKEPSPGHEPGVKLLPDFLKQHQFHASIRHASAERIVPPSYSMTLDQESGVRNAENIACYAQQQSLLLNNVLHRGDFCIALGGDCSILIGNAIALKRLGKFGLFFLDGHTDFMMPDQSQTGGAAGMDLAIAAGHGHDKLTNIDGLKPYFEERHIWCVGNREYDENYVKTILDSDIHYRDLKILRSAGIQKCVNDFISMINTERLDGFWIHVDLDVLNDDIMPAVDSRNEDGLSYHEFNEMLSLLLSEQGAAGIEITILDPELDPYGTYTRAFVSNFCDVFNKSIVH